MKAEFPSPEEQQMPYLAESLEDLSEEVFYEPINNQLMLDSALRFAGDIYSTLDVQLASGQYAGQDYTPGAHYFRPSDHVRGLTQIIATAPLVADNPAILINQMVDMAARVVNYPDT